MKNRIVLSVMMWCMLFGTLTSCSEGPFSEDPEIEDFPESQLGFYNASTVLRDSIETTEPNEAFILLNEDNLETDQERANFSQLHHPPYLYPSGGITNTYPYWLGYLRLAPGPADVRFMDTDSTELVHTQVLLEDQKKTSLYLSDSLGTWHTLSLPDNSSPETGKVQFRVVHLSPDAGECLVKVNNEWLDLPESLNYREASDYLAYEVASDESDPLLRIQLRDAVDTTSVVTRTSLSTVPGHSYTFIVLGYSQAHPEHDIQRSSLQISAIRNN